MGRIVAQLANTETSPTHPWVHDGWHARAGLEGVVIQRLALYERLDILLQKKNERLDILYFSD